MPQEITSNIVQGVLMSIYGCGVLITGASGIGKSEAALGLIRLGHLFIADDCVSIDYDIKNKHLLGRSPARLQNLLEVRGLGIMNIATLFGCDAIAKSAAIEFIIQLIQLNNDEFHALDRLSGIRSHHTIAGISIPEISIPMQASRNTPLLIETAVRHFQTEKCPTVADEVYLVEKKYLLE